MQGTELYDAQGIEDDAHEAQNVQRQVALDDGASINYLNPANQDTPLPWLTPGRSIRVGASVTIDDPVIFEFRNNLWKFQPQHQLTGDGSSLATFEDTRPANLNSAGGWWRAEHRHVQRPQLLQHHRPRLHPRRGCLHVLRRPRAEPGRRELVRLAHSR